MLIPFLTSLCAIAFLGAPAHAATVTIDCAVDQGPANHVANGYLTSLCPTQPANSLIAPLKPTTFRSDYNSLRGVYTNYDRLYSLGTRDFQVTLAYNYDIPYQMREIGYSVSWSTWTDFVNQAVDSFVSSGKVVSYDIFNEPDLGGFRTEEDMYTLWRTTFNLIRARDPSAKIVGPSVAYAVNLRPFLLRAKAEGVFPDIVAFHQYGDPAIARPYMSDLRGWLVANGMGTPPISVNEIIGDGLWLNTGYVAGTLAAYDRAGVVSAHKACWEDPNNPQPNTPPYTYHCCNNFVLDGLLNVDTVGTRAGWWVYKAYAEVTGRLVNLYTSTDRIDGIAGLDANAGGAAALIGKYGDDGGGVTTLVVKNLSSAPYLIQQNGSVHITALRIPNTGAATLNGLVTEANVSVIVNNDSIQVALPNFGYQDAYQVLLGASAIGPAPDPTPNPTPGVQTPYSGTPMAIPGTIKTSFYDYGGEGVAFHDTDSVNQMSSTFRSGEGVDTDGSSIGWVLGTEWLEYTVNVATAGAYTISIPLCYPGTGGSMHISMNGVNVTGTFAFPNTGSWSTYQNVTKTVNLNAGTQVMRVSFDSNGSNGYAPGVGDLISINVIAPNQPPVVSLTAPADNAAFTTPVNITLSATASDSDGTINQVEFYQGTTLLGTDTNSPYSFTWSNAPAGSYALTAKATDDLGAQTTSAAANITVTNPPPVVSLTAPANNATFMTPANITLNATASDSNGTVSKVEFFQDTTLLGTDTSSPYSFAWNNVPAGSYALTAKATDNLGAHTTSAIINITVTTPPPSTPYGGVPTAIPGNLTMSLYDNGGEGVAYHDLEAANLLSSTFRPGEGVDANSGVGLGSIKAGEWVKYTVNVSGAGSYALSVPVSSQGNGGTLHISFGGVNKTGTLSVPNTGANKTKKLTSTVSLSAGVQVMQIFFDTNGSSGFTCTMSDVMTFTPVGTG